LGGRLKESKGRSCSVITFLLHSLCAYRCFKEYFSSVEYLASSSFQQPTSTMYFLVLLLFYGTVQLLSLLSFSSFCCLCFAFGTFVWSWWMLHRACLCAVCPAVSPSFLLILTTKQNHVPVISCKINRTNQPPLSCMKVTELLSWL